MGKNMCGSVAPSASPLCQNALGSWSPSSKRSPPDRKSTRLNSSHSQISYAVFCLKKKISHPVFPVAEKPGEIVQHVQRRVGLEQSQAPRWCTPARVPHVAKTFALL